MAIKPAPLPGEFQGEALAMVGPPGGAGNGRSSPDEAGDVPSGSAVELGLAEKLIAQRVHVVRVYRHDAAGSEVLAAQHGTGAGGPPAPGAAAPDVPPGEFRLKLRDLLVPPSHAFLPRSGTRTPYSKMNVH